MPLRKVRDLNDKIEAARGHREIFDKVRRDNARKYRGFEAWQAVIRASEAAVDLPFDEGMKREREEFMNLVLDAAGACPALRVLRRAQGLEDRRRSRHHADTADQEGRRHRRRHDGRRHIDEFSQCRNSGDDRRNRAAGARPWPRHHPPQLREHRQERAARSNPTSKRGWDCSAPASTSTRWPTAISSSRRSTRTWTSRRRCSASSTRSPSRARSSPPTPRT